MLLIMTTPCDSHLGEEVRGAENLDER